jgi:hypothetical protein
MRRLDGLADPESYYCTYDRQEITAWLARGAAARVSINFRNFFHASRARGAPARV